MVYRVALLDTEEAESDTTEKLIARYGKIHPEHELEISCYRKLQPFMEAVCGLGAGETAGWTFDILIMDVELPDGNGIEAASLLRRKGFGGMIIFQSRTADYALEAYGVNALQYLVKPISRERFDRAMERAVKEIRPSPVFFAEKGIIPVFLAGGRQKSRRKR